MAILQEKVGLTNEDLRKLRSMRPGRPIDLQLSTTTTTKRVRTEFVGMDGTRCMIFRFPDEGKWGSLGDGIFKDKTMIARYILEDDTGEIIAFKVKVILVTTKPSHLIFTSFPLIIQSHDLRAEPRSKTRIATSMFDAQSDLAICNSMVLDISVNGCRMSIDKGGSNTKPKIKQVVKMYFAGSKDKEIFLIGTIMNSNSDEVSLYYGVKFETPKSEVKQLLQDLMLVTG
ncbi:PilZ domain-containing protein [Paraglaciecola sp. MB-3u-78]|uniref:PilZ domain-containing protein n=1 Tax=Paraglaciecola sp. MB-3u-78 TaxID=2058332 RepID=UPI000C331A89|nr:PilZ domain-containing protein [Paraglaciecola sp. MB-3u-78]PKG99162.1 flagellar brake protein [Paraglaciecola sp. MB-3u-78]